MKTNRSTVLWLSLAGLIMACSTGFAAGESTREIQRVELWHGKAPIGDGQFEAKEVWLTVYHPTMPTGTAAVICPGGGYSAVVVEPEGHGIARWLNGHGITGIVLEYRLPAGRTFVPLTDAQRAMRTVRSKAGEWKINPHRIGIMGFSAGGHLASTAATHFDQGDPQATDAVNRTSCRPDFAILVYPVITMGEKTHLGSKANLLGKDPKPEMVELFSNEKQVTDQTPPTFLAHAIDDNGVVIDNSRLIYAALQAHRVPSQLLELPSGGHGLNGYQGPMWDAWQEKSLAWLAEIQQKPGNAPASK